MPMLHFIVRRGPTPPLAVQRRYKACYHELVDRLLARAPAGLKAELGNVVAVALGRCRDLELRATEADKRVLDLHNQKQLLTQRAKQLTKMLACTKSSARALNNKVLTPAPVLQQAVHTSRSPLCWC